MYGAESPLNLRMQDLTLLMEAYKNNIALTTTLLEQEKQVIQQQDVIINSQNRLCESISDAIKDSNEKIRTINIAHTEILNTIRTIETGMKLEFETRTSVVKTDIAAKTDTLKGFIYGSYVGMISIILSLIGLMILIFEKIH